MKTILTFLILIWGCLYGIAESTIVVKHKTTGGLTCTTANDVIVFQQTTQTSPSTGVNTTSWRSAQFNLSAQTRITQIDLIIEDGGTGILELNVASDSSGLPGANVSGLYNQVGSALLPEAPGVVANVFATPTTVAAGTYHVKMASSGGEFYPYYTEVASGGNLEWSNDSGATWNNYDTGSYYIVVWGCQ